MRNLKRALSLLLSSTMVLGMVVMGGSAVGYQDVDDTYHKEAIEVLQAAGIMTGVDSAGNFNPEGTVTRNEMAVIMSNLMAYNVATYSGTSPFTDVPDWAEPYVAACWTNGITAGTSETTYGGDQTVTTAQAALMIMKALGYFQYQSDFGSDWQLATVSQGNKIDLFTDVNSGVKEAMTRNDVAQLVLNGLESGIVEAETSGTITVGDITIVNDVKYNLITSGEDYAKAINDQLDTSNNVGGSTGKYTVELGEKLYLGDLMKKSDEDNFGRPAYTWSYDNKEIGTYANEADYTYTKSVSEKALYNELGATAVDYNWTVYYNGVNLGSVKPEKNVTDTYSKTATGTLTEVFVDNVAKKVVVTMVDTFLAEVVRVQENADDVTVTLNYLSAPTNNNSRSTTVTLASTDLAVDDKVLVTTYEDGNQFTVDSIVKAETVTGTVTAVKSRYDQDGNYGKYAVMDDKQYDYVGNTFAEDLADTALNDPTINAENTLYLDAYGNMIAFEATKRTVDYVYLDDAIDALGGINALATFPDGTEATIYVDEVDGQKKPTEDDMHMDDGKGSSDNLPFAAGIYAYEKQGDAYQLISLTDANSADNVWTNRPSYDTTRNVGYVDNGVSGTSVNVSNYMFYSIKNGTNAIQAVEKDALTNGNTVNTQNVVSLTSSTIFVDVEGNVIYTGYNNVPTMNDISFFVVYNRQLNADVVFITDGADNSSSDSFFYVTDSKPVTTQKDGTYYYEYSVMMNNEKTTITFKGTNKDSANAPIASDTLYKIDTITPEGYVKSATPVAGFGLGYSASTDVATYADGYTLRLKRGADIADTGSNNLDNNSGEYIYSYNKDTQFVYIETKMDGSSIVSKSVGVGSANMINTTNDKLTGNNNVYVVAVDDKTARTPVATLVYIVEPVDGTFVNYTVTYPTTKPANIDTYKVEVGGSDVTADGTQTLVKGTQVKVTATPVAGYDAVIKVNGVENASGIFNVTGNTTITIETKIADTTKGTTVQGISDAGGALTLLYTDTKPSDADALNKVVAEVLAAGYTEGTPLVDDKGSGSYEINVMKGYMPIKFTFNTASDIKQGLTGKVNGKEMLVANGTALNALSGAAAGTYYQANANTGLTSANDFTVDGKTYVASTATITAEDFDVTISTGYVKVTGADATGVAQVGEDYTVPAKTAFAGAKGTGVEYTIDSAKKYAAYEGTIPSSEIDGTHDITLAASYVTVSFVLDESLTTDWSITDDSANTAYVQVSSSMTVQTKVTKTAPHGLSNAQSSTATVDNSLSASVNTGKTSASGSDATVAFDVTDGTNLEQNITVTITAIQD